MWYQVVGWYGVVAILLAYVGTTLVFVSPESGLYLLLNGSGALALIVQSYAIKNWQLVVLNVVWLVVALIALGQTLIQ